MLIYLVKIAIDNMTLILHPEYEKLKKELTDLIYEYDELKNQIAPQIERKYLNLFGLLEYGLYKKEVELKKLELKLRLIQIQINNEEEIDIDQINQKIKKKFEKYDESLKKQIDELNSTLNSKFKKLSKEDAKKIKELYRKCILKLHPDLNPNQSQHNKLIFSNITQAFKNGDLTSLETLVLLIDGDDDNSNEIDNLKESIENMKNKISEFKEKYPYNKVDLLENPKMIKDYENELKRLIELYSQKIDDYKQKIARFGLNG